MQKKLVNYTPQNSQIVGILFDESVTISANILSVKMPESTVSICLFLP
jgi:hypothetical protein